MSECVIIAVFEKKLQVAQRVHGVAVLLIYVAVREPEKIPLYADMARRL